MSIIDQWKLTYVWAIYIKVVDYCMDLLCGWIYMYIKQMTHVHVHTLYMHTCISSVESQKGVIAAQWCSVENQKGTIALQSLWHSTLLVLNGTSLNSDSACLALNWQFLQLNLFGVGEAHISTLPKTHKSQSPSSRSCLES